MLWNWSTSVVCDDAIFFWPFLFCCYIMEEGRVLNAMARHIEADIDGGVWMKLMQILWFFLRLFGTFFSFLHGALLRGCPLAGFANKQHTGGLQVEANMGPNATNGDFGPTPPKAHVGIPAPHIQPRPIGQVLS